MKKIFRNSYKTVKFQFKFGIFEESISSFQNEVVFLLLEQFGFGFRLHVFHLVVEVLSNFDHFIEVEILSDFAHFYFVEALFGKGRLASAMLLEVVSEHIEHESLAEGKLGSSLFHLSSDFLEVNRLARLEGLEVFLR